MLLSLTQLQEVKRLLECRAGKCIPTRICEIKARITEWKQIFEKSAFFITNSVKSGIYFIIWLHYCCEFSNVNIKNWCRNYNVIHLTQCEKLLVRHHKEMMSETELFSYHSIWAQYSHICYYWLLLLLFLL